MVTQEVLGSLFPRIQRRAGPWVVAKSASRLQLIPLRNIATLLGASVSRSRMFGPAVASLAIQPSQSASRHDADRGCAGVDRMAAVAAKRRLANSSARSSNLTMV